jgi:hypothetical protein
MTMIKAITLARGNLEAVIGLAKNETKVTQNEPSFNNAFLQKAAAFDSRLCHYWALQKKDGCVP